MPHPYDLVQERAVGTQIVMLRAECSSQCAGLRVCGFAPCSHDILILGPYVVVFVGPHVLAGTGCGCSHSGMASISCAGCLEAFSRAGNNRFSPVTAGVVSSPDWGIRVRCRCRMVEFRMRTLLPAGLG